MSAGALPSHVVSMRAPGRTSNRCVTGEWQLCVPWPRAARARRWSAAAAALTEMTLSAGAHCAPSLGAPLPRAPRAVLAAAHPAQTLHTAHTVRPAANRDPADSVQAWVLGPMSFCLGDPALSSHTACPAANGGQLATVRAAHLQSYNCLYLACTPTSSPCTTGAPVHRLDYSACSASAVHTLLQRRCFALQLACVPKHTALACGAGPGTLWPPAVLSFLHSADSCRARPVGDFRNWHACQCFTTMPCLPCAFRCGKALRCRCHLLACELRREADPIQVAQLVDLGLQPVFLHSTPHIAPGLHGDASVTKCVRKPSTPKRAGNTSKPEKCVRSRHTPRQRMPERQVPCHPKAARAAFG